MSTALLDLTPIPKLLGQPKTGLRRGDIHSQIGQKARSPKTDCKGDAICSSKTFEYIDLIKDSKREYRKVERFPALLRSKSESDLQQSEEGNFVSVVSVQSSPDENYTQNELKRSENYTQNELKRSENYTQNELKRSENYTQNEWIPRSPSINYELVPKVSFLGNYTQNECNFYEIYTQNECNFYENNTQNECSFYENYTQNECTFYAQNECNFSENYTQKEYNFYENYTQNEYRFREEVSKKLVYLWPEVFEETCSTPEAHVEDFYCDGSIFSFEYFVDYDRFMFPINDNQSFHFFGPWYNLNSATAVSFYYGRGWKNYTQNECKHAESFVKNGSFFCKTSPETTLKTSGEDRPTWRHSSADYFCYGGGPLSSYNEKRRKLHSKRV